MAYDSYQQDGNFVENSGNRVVLFNDLYALKWSQGFWDDSLVATAGLRFAQGGPQGAEYLRETLGEVERQRSGFEGTDAFVELFAVPLEDIGQVSWLSDGALLDSWTLMVSADLRKIISTLLMMRAVTEPTEGFGPPLREFLGSRLSALG